MIRSKKFCKKYRSMSQHKTCEAGVSYEEIVKAGMEAGKSSLPCWGAESNPLGVVCEKCEYPTPAEVAELEAWRKKRFEDVGKARDAIVEFLGGPWKKGIPGECGSIKCPCCGSGTLSFTRSGYNGHIHAACQTEGCVRWME
jgi:hypothetical protein